MTDASPNDLNFGHFGQPVYDLDNSQWAFGRNPHAPAFKQLGSWKPVVPAAVQFPSSRLPRPIRSIQQATSGLVRHFPDVAAAAEYVPALEAVSAAATAATSTYDAAIGELMSFGSISSPGNYGRRPRQVVALPAGEAGNILRLQLLADERYGWGEHRQSIYLLGQSMGKEYGFWNEEAAPIQQVCFAQTEERQDFLAVRLPRRTVLFQPTFQSHRKAAAKSPFFHLPPSTLDIHPFHAIWIEDTGSSPHADVAFNPHYQRQLAIIDQDLKWSVWDIDGGYRFGFSVKRTAGGRSIIRDEVESSEPEVASDSREDGWARIMWAGDANTIVVCSRRTLELFNLKGPIRSLKCSQVIDWRSLKDSSNDWILDVKRHAKNEKQFFVLTSVRLYLLEVTCPSDGPHAESRDTGAAILLSWVHFRGVEDITLQLYVQMASDEETTVFIHSRLNSLITVYRLVNQASSTAPYCSFGPNMLRLNDLDSTPEPRRMRSFNIQRLEFKERENSLESGLGRQYRDSGIQFYQLHTMSDDLSVAQAILYTTDANANDSSLISVELLSWSALVRPYLKIRDEENESIPIEDADFVEPDGLIDTPAPLSKSLYQLPEPLKQKLVGPSRHVFDFSSLYEAVSCSASSPHVHSRISSATVDVSDVVKEVERLFEEGQVEELPLGTLQEFASLRVTVDDIDETSSRLQELFPAEQSTSPAELRRIASSQVLGFGSREAHEPLSLSSAYDLLLRNWVAPLPAGIPVRIRQNKERMARRIAAEVMLASMRVRHPGEGEVSPATRPGPSQDSAVALPSSLPQLTPPASWQSQFSSPLDDGNNVNPPTPSATTSDPISRLSKHVHMKNPQAATFPPSITQVLSHWQIGADPTTYDWEATERVFAEELELEQEGTQQRREKARRKKERKEKRQKRENQLFTGKVESQPPMLRSSPGPMLAASSSQVPGPSQSQSQSQGFGGLGVQSQVEPGRHGGRPAKKKKVKTRMSGF